MLSNDHDNSILYKMTKRSNSNSNYYENINNNINN